MADPGLVSRMVRREIEAARSAAAARRKRVDTAAKDYDAFVERIALPTLRLLANILKAEGVAFEVSNPTGGVRLVFERYRDDLIELELDTSEDPPQPVLLSKRTRGRRTLQSEGPVKPGAAISSITEDEFLARMLTELRPWFE